MIKYRNTFRFIVGVLTIGLLLGTFPISAVKASSITTLAVGLSSTNTSTVATVTMTFTPATAITNGSVIEVTYDTAFTGGASLLDADISVTGTSITSSTETGMIAGYFKSTLVTSGSVTGTVTITIDNSPGLTTPSTIGNYGWSISVDIGAAHTTYDTGAGLAYIGGENAVQITAVVPPVIDMELYVQNSDTLLTNTPNGCALGVLSLSTVRACVYDIGIATNNTAGVTVKVQADGKLRSGANDVNDVTDTAVTAGSEEYGFRVTDVGTGCSITAASTYGTQDNTVPTSVTTFFSNAAVCNGTTAGQSAKRAEITHKASMDTNTVVASNYAQVVTYTAFTN